MSDTIKRIATQAGLRRTDEPFRVAVRRLRWFRASFRTQTEVIAERTGIEFQILEDRLTRAFITWLRQIESRRPADPDDRPAYFDFAAGQMLRELLREPPLRVTRIPDGANRDAPEIVWPEGFVCTTFCLSVRAAVFAQEFDAMTQISPQFDETRTWWSFLENVSEDTSQAAAFFQMFVGNEPDWLMPDVFHRGLFQEVVGASASPGRLQGD